ncbi:MAG: DNA methyltransferase [Nanoarchaeota archaeon]
MSIDTGLIYRGDCHTVLKRQFPSGDDEQGIDLIYVDPPFSFDPQYARLWYDKETLEMFEELRKGGTKHYIAWMSKRLEQCHRVLKNTGSMYLHCDWKFGHYLKIEMDNIFGKNNLQNEIIWHYRTGGRAKKHFSRKHDTIFFYSKGKHWVFDLDGIGTPRKICPYCEEEMESWNHLRRHVDKEERVFRTIKSDGKIYRYYDDERVPPSDVWIDISHLQQKDPSRTGYLTQKPDGLLERIIKVSSNPGDIVLDPMCGCGTTIAVAHELERQWIGIDISPQACEIMKERMEKLEGLYGIPVIGLPLTVKDLKELDPFEFQDYICEMTNSEKPPRRVADEGIDGYYFGEIPIQVKQQERVGRVTIDNFETALRRKGKNRGYVIGFSFTRNAHEEVARAMDDGLDISLVCVDELIIRDYELESVEE